MQVPMLKAGLNFSAVLKLIEDTFATLPALESAVKGLEAGKIPPASDIALLGKLIADVKAVLA